MAELPNSSNASVSKENEKSDVKSQLQDRTNPPDSSVSKESKESDGKSEINKSHNTNHDSKSRKISLVELSMETLKVNEKSIKFSS